MATTNKRPFAELLIYLLPFFLLIVLAVLYYPSYKYHIEGDGIGYLASVKRYVDGDYYNAINGFWSPLNIWIVALCTKATGLSIIASAYFINSLSFCAVLLLSIRLFTQFISGKFEAYIFGFSMAIFWLINMQLALFADGMNAAFLLCCLFVLLNTSFCYRPKLWVLLGMLAALAYLSKTYSFYIIPFLTLAISFFKLKREGNVRLGRLLVIMVVVMGVMIFFSLPWIFLLHYKYHTWTISNAGTLNNSWFVLGRMYFGNEINILVPPPYKNSLSCWEDLWFHKGETIGMFASVDVIVSRIRRLIINIIKWPTIASEFSPFYFVSWIFAIVYFWSNPYKNSKNNKFTILILAFLLFPIGYFTLLIATRYIWFTVPLALVIGMFSLQQWLYPRLNNTGKKLLVILYMISWLPASVLQMITTRQDGQSFYGMAEKLKELHITNASFVSNNGTTNLNQDFCISYYTNNSVFMNFKEDWTMGALLEESLKFKVKYLFYFYQNDDKDFILKDANGMPYPEMTHGTINGLKVFQLTR